MASSEMALTEARRRQLGEYEAHAAEMTKWRAGFNAEADDRYARIVESGSTIPWDAMRRYLAQRISGASEERPSARTVAR